VNDVEEPLKKGMGLNLGGIGKSAPAQSAQIGLNIRNSQNQEEMEPEVKRGGEGRGVPGLNPALADKTEALNDEDFDYKGTSRKQYEHSMYNGVCSMILDDFLYLGSDVVA